MGNVQAMSPRRIDASRLAAWNGIVTVVPTVNQEFPSRAPPSTQRASRVVEPMRTGAAAVASA
jgi:hypothetical protein